MLKSNIKIVTDAKKPSETNYAVCKVLDFKEILTNPMTAIAVVEYYAENDLGEQTFLGQYMTTLTAEELNALYELLTPDPTKPYTEERMSEIYQATRFKLVTDGTFGLSIEQWDIIL